MPTQPLPSNPSLENLRKQAKSLRTAVQANQTDALARVREFHPRVDEALRDFSLSDAQLVIARSYEFASWTKLKQHLEVVDLYKWSPPAEVVADYRPGAIADRFISLACLNYGEDFIQRRVQARELFAANPSLSQENVYAATTVGDVAVLRRLLDAEPALAKKRGGPYGWEPLLYACYSRLDSTAEGHSTLEVARLLLEHGADPNAGFLWDAVYLFTALTGAFGEGERGPVNQPEHQYCYELARLLLEAGADPNDGQTLYNRMFRPGNRHLELLFEFGLGQKAEGVWSRRLGGRSESPARMLNDQLAWAVKHHFPDRVQLLISHGADLNSNDNRFRRASYELARLSGQNEIAEYLRAHGAQPVALRPFEEFAAACSAADETRARALVANDAELLASLGSHRVELLQQAAGSDNRAAIRLMVSLGFDVNEIRRTAAIHDAAGSGHLEMVKLLIELGADPLLRDQEFNGTPLGWASYGHEFGGENRARCGEVVEFLKQFEAEPTN